MLYSFFKSRDIFLKIETQDLHVEMPDLHIEMPDSENVMWHGKRKNNQT